MRHKSCVSVLLFLVPLSGQAGSFHTVLDGASADLQSIGLNLVVDSPLDLGDTDPGDGYCSTAMGTCTLRAAIEETNAYPGADSITLPADTYVLSSSLTAIDAVSVFGEDRDTTIIDANGAETALTVFWGVTLDSVTVRGGTRAGIWTYGWLSLISSRVRDNSGSGVECWSYERPVVSILDSEVSENGGNGVDIVDCDAWIVGCSISRNAGRGVTVAEGGSAAMATLENSYVAENLGGGLEAAGTASIYLQSTTVTNNVAEKGAGFSSDGCGTLAAANSTFSGNRSTGHGGGIFLPSNYCGGSSSLIHTTIAENIADSDADGIGDGGGIFSGVAVQPGLLTSIEGTILANNVTPRGGASDCAGPEALVSEGFNLIGDTRGCTIVGDTSTNITNVDPVLGPLADNGGMTPTHRPSVLSPAIDAIPPGDCTVASDQRGVARPQGPGCDIGSVEAGLFCEGFEPPMASGPVIVRGRRVLPFKAQLFGGDGQLVTDLDLTAPPHIQVWYEYGTPDAEDVSDEARSTGQRTRGRMFFFDANERWHYNLATRVYSESGTYTVFMVSSDESEYFVEPTCRAQFVLE